MPGNGINTFICHSGSISTTASTAKFHLAVATVAAQDLALVGYRISMDTSSGPVVFVEILRISALGTSSGTPTAYKWANQTGRSANAVPKSTWSVDPTVGDLVEQFWLTPNQPTFVYDYVYPYYPDMGAGAANGFAVRCTPGASSTPNVRTSLIWAE